VLAGILLGPSLLGLVAPGVREELFPEEAVQLLVAIGNVGLGLFVFMVGLELDRSKIETHRQGVLGVSIGSLVVPLGAGLVLSLPLYEAHGTVNGEQISQLPFMLFVATALSVTAFPVLARILSDQGLAGTPLAIISLSAAAVLDFAGWLLLGAVLTLFAGQGVDGLARTLLELFLFLVVARWVVIPVLFRSLARLRSGVGFEKVTLVAAAALGCGGLTQLIGLHSVLGAVALALLLPRNETYDAVRSSAKPMEPLISSLLVPVYFSVSGMGVDLTGLDAGGVLEIVILTAVASLTKVGGSAAGARLAGISGRDSWALGILMNTRGLMEVVVLNVGYAAGLLDQALFSELLLVALIATFMTPPLIEAVKARRPSAFWTREVTAVPSET
jgi:Kef-type K+ transport system membrane component KefB